MFARQLWWSWKTRKYRIGRSLWQWHQWRMSVIKAEIVKSKEAQDDR